jgi:hypothetical protein
VEAIRLVPLQQIPLIGYTRLRRSRIDQRAVLTAIRGSRYAGHEGDGRRGTLGELMAKKVVGDVMIIQKNDSGRGGPPPPLS